MLTIIRNIWNGLPMQLFILHLRKNKLSLLFWFFLFASINNYLLPSVGTRFLFLAPDYLSKGTNFLGEFLLGASIGVFIMAWNINSFILDSSHIKFLATSQNPFLIYNINNAIIPLLFLVDYTFVAKHFYQKELLINSIDSIALTGGFWLGTISTVFLGFIYFQQVGIILHSYNKKQIEGILNEAGQSNEIDPHEYHDDIQMPVKWYLNASLKIRKIRPVFHYKNKKFLDNIFKQQHMASFFPVVLAFVGGVFVGFFPNTKYLQVPAAVSVVLLLSILISAIATFSLLFRSWSFICLIILYVFVNFLYKKGIIDSRSKVFGMSYNTKEYVPYNVDHVLSLTNEDSIAKDKQLFMNRLNAWKYKQKEKKPILYIINVSGGGLRSAYFSFRIMQRLDSMMNGELMNKTFFITGASGGMLGATYFRQLYLYKQMHPSINLSNNKYLDNISSDLLNPIFSGFITRDLLGPILLFKTKDGYSYNKDRAYEFEQKLNENTGGVLNHSLDEVKSAEDNATVPTIIFNALSTIDLRLFAICSTPCRFLMIRDQQSPTDSTVHKNNFMQYSIIDFNSFFANNHSTDMTLLTLLRMNSTFPFVLPNVLLPTNPETSITDPGAVDNIGFDVTSSFLYNFQDWIKKNTSGVVLIQIYDRSYRRWNTNNPASSFLNSLAETALSLVENNDNLQGYDDEQQLSILKYMLPPLKHKVIEFNNENKDWVSLSFHLTQGEKNIIYNAAENANLFK